ncbi:M20/M25/M40 family metallo-hydrolase [Candidatus Daviesbacteria bacterium]|nr:M20/M25/M40 family metallo-hydrolase [Candidatus Daviesbacteria bacterium]
MVDQKRLVETFLDLVKIDSPSGEEEEMAKELMKRLKTLGFKVLRDTYGNVIGTLDGAGEPIMLNAHMDTVEPGRGIKPIIDGDIIKSDGTTVLGGDPKAGVTAILEALTSVIEDGKKHLPIEVVFTREEESSLGGAINLDYSQISAKRGVTFDGEKELHNIDISSPGYNSVNVTVIGRAAHAGADPEKGLSAIQIASEIISQLQLGRIDKETTANIGLIEGGSARNAVPEKVHFKGEIRSRNKEKLEKHTKHFQEVFDNVLSKYPNAKIDADISREFEAYFFDENHRVIKHIREVFKQMNLSPNLQHSGGGTDVNIFHTHGIEAVVVGTGDFDAHTTREYVVIPQMVQAAEFCQKLISV